MINMITHGYEWLAEPIPKWSVYGRFSTLAMSHQMCEDQPFRWQQRTLFAIDATAGKRFE